MFISASASVTAAALSVGVSLLLGALLNQMTGGQGYDFTDAFQDAVTVYPNLEENFENSDVYPIEKIEIDRTKVDIPDDYHFSTFGGTSADKTLIEMEKAINEMLESGEIEIYVDEQGNVSMPTLSWCNTVGEIYDRFGIYKNKNGLNYVRTYWSIVSDYIESVWQGWDQTVCKYEIRPNSNALNFVPYFVQNDTLTFLNLRFYVTTRSVTLRLVTSGSLGESGTGALKVDPDLFNQGSGVESLSCYHSFCFNPYLMTASMSASNNVDSVSCDYDGSDNSSFLVGLGGTSFDSSYPVQDCGYVLLKEGSSVVSSFKIAATEGSIESKKNTDTIPLTGVEQTISNMGLDGVGTGSTAGTVSVNSTTKEIVVTNEVTQEAEKVIEQPKVSDIDLPDSDTIIDKFPFSLPFDIYRLLTIFVADEKEPIFEVPIKTSFGWSGIDVNVDESFTLDFTQFKINGIDIVQCLVRTSFNVLFIAFLIKITYKMIHK